MKFEISPFNKRLFLYLLLVSAYILVSFFKVNRFWNAVTLLPGNEKLLFFTEGAFQYRYAEMTARGERIPANDVNAQYPEGIRPFSELKMLMPLAHGYTYRLFNKLVPGIPFCVYLVFFISLYTSLIMFVVFAVNKLLWKDTRAALLMSVLYAASWASFSRTLPSGSSFIPYNLEDFSLLLIFCNFAFFMKGLAEDRPARSAVNGAAAGIFLALASCGWHFTAFYFFIFSFSAAIVTLAGIALNRRDNMLELLAGFALFFTGTRLPAPAAAGDLGSVPMLIICALVLFLGLQKLLGAVSRAEKYAAFAACMLAAGIASYFAARGTNLNYTHVYSLFLDKLRFLGAKPDDPSLLRFESKLLWIEDFNNIDLRHLLPALSCLLLGVPGLFLLIANLPGRDFKNTDIFLVCSGSAFVLLYLLANRLCVFAAFFLAVFCGYFFSRFIFRLRKRIYAPLILLIALLEALALAYYGSPGQMRPVFQTAGSAGTGPRIAYPYNIAELTGWVNADTRAGDAIVSDFQFGPSILLITGRPVVFHSKFESRAFREKYGEFIRALYGPEKDFYALCSRYGARYFVYDIPLVLDKSKDSRRYLTCNLQLSRDCAAFKFHFSPENLRYFRLCFRNAYFSVYEAGRTGKRARAYDYPYINIYDLKTFTADGRMDF
jgi:hypothetical protein